MGSSTRAGTSENKVTFTASKSGRYKVKVYGYRAGSYKLIVDVGDGGGAGKSFDTAITLRNSASGYVTGTIVYTTSSTLKEGRKLPSN